MHASCYILSQSGKMPKLFNDGLLEPVLTKPKNREYTGLSGRKCSISSEPPFEVVDDLTSGKRKPTRKQLNGKTRSRSASSAVAGEGCKKNNVSFESPQIVNSCFHHPNPVIEPPASQGVVSSTLTVQDSDNNEKRNDESLAFTVDGICQAVLNEAQELSLSVKTILKPIRRSKVDQLQNTTRRTTKVTLSEKILRSSRDSAAATCGAAAASCETSGKYKPYQEIERKDLPSSSLVRFASPRNGLFRFVNGHVKLLADILQYNGFVKVCGAGNGSFCQSSKSQPNFSTNKEVDLVWCCQHLRGQALLNLPPFKKINLFPHSYECTRKDSLARNINLLIQIHGWRNFNFMPECFVWPQERELIEQAIRCSHSSNGRYISGVNFRCPWIIKPASSCQGKGIHIVTEFREIEEHISEDELHIVERYIHNPLLLYHKKFDLRIYVLVTSFNPLKVYVHREGLVRRASEIYDFGVDGFDNKFSHLTNYSINKTNVTNTNCKNGEDTKNSDDVEDKFGLKMSFSDLNDWFESSGCTNADTVWKLVDDLIIKTLIVVEGKVNTGLSSLTINPDACFELFGFDVLIDDTFQPWLMEVNFAPSLAADSPLDFSVKTKVLTDMLNMVGFKKASKGDSNKNKSSSEFNISKFAVKKNLKCSYIGTDAIGTDDTLSNNPLQNFCCFSFHHNYELRDIDMDGYIGELRDLSFPDEECGSTSSRLSHLKAEELKQHEKIAILQFREEFLASHDRRVVNEFLLEQIRCERSQNGFRLIYPSDAKYGVYHTFFSEMRYNNELLGRLAFYVYAYKEIISNYTRSKKKITAKNAHPSKQTTDTDTDEEITFQPQAWSQIHNKWARALGRSTSNI